jgi:hypothetical protein
MPEESTMSLIRIRLTSLLVALLCALAAAPGLAFQPTSVSEDPFEILPPPEQSAYVDVTSKHGPSIEMGRAIEEELGGSWNVALWNQYAVTPRAVYGTGIELVPGGLHSEAQVEEVARQFIASHPAIFRADESRLATYRITHGLGKWVIQFQQTVAGEIRVEDAFVHLVFMDSGRLYAFGSNYYQGASVPSGPTMAPENAVGIARAGLPYDPASEVPPIRGDETVILPMLKNGPDGQQMVFRLAHRTEVPTSEPYGNYATYVDAVTGEILLRQNQVAEAYSGRSRGDVEIPTYCSGNTPNTPFAHMNVAISGVGTAVTDANGNFSIGGDSGPQTYTAVFDGPVVNVNCSGCAGGDAVATGPISPDVPLDIYFPSFIYRADERDCFYFINKTRDFVESIDSTWTYPKVTANVNVNATCNANWNGTILNFFRTGGGCHNTGEIGDVMAHEFGHCIQASLNGGSQATQGLGEGNADIAGTFIVDGSVIGIGFQNCENGLSCPGSSCRDCENTLRYPGDVVGQPIHSAGRVICGFNWDTRQALEAKYGAAAGKIKCAELWHFGRKMFGNPGMTQPDQVLAYFVINDDNGNLGDGTPDYDEICQGATNHGFSCPTILVGVFITHQPLGNTSDTQNPYEVVALITSTVTTLNPDSLLVRYQLEFLGGYMDVQMTPTGNPDEYHGFIPAQGCGTQVDYFIVAEDNAGNRKTDPTSAPAATHSFTVADLIYTQTFESASDWTQDPSHTASTGAFVRIDPNPTGFQPDDDASPPPGIFGWITAQNTGGDGVDDVDNGVSATRSPIFDLADYAGAHLSMKWFHGQRDQGGDPNGDFFQISLSNDGGATYPVNIIALGDVSHAATWTALEVDLETYLPLTSQMRLRVQAADGPAVGDIVEGGIDEVYILGCVVSPDTIPPSVTVTSPNGGEALVMGTNHDITWTATDNDAVTGVDILLSNDGGATFPVSIATNEPNDGSYTWLVPNTPTPSARIKIIATDSSFLTAEDESDGNFIIGPPPSAAPEITLTAPNGGEVIDGLSSYEITWNATDDIEVTGVDISLSLDGGVTFPILLATDEENDGAYTWLVTDTATTQARVLVVAEDANFQTDSAISAADFTITSAAPEITLTAPNGGEVIDASTTSDITWNATDDNEVTGVDISLSLDGGATFPIDLATDEENDGVFTWSVTDTATTQARVRVVAKDAGLRTDTAISAADFTITLAATGISPNTAVPDRYFLGPSFPEPFRDNAVVRFGLPRPTTVDLAVYSVEGRVIRHLAGGATPAGTWERYWNGTDDSGSRVPSGLYFLRLSTPEGILTQRITFLR